MIGESCTSLCVVPLVKSVRLRGAGPKVTMVAFILSTVVALVALATVVLPWLFLLQLLH